GGGFSHADEANRHAVDFAVPTGTPVLAAREGVVMQAEDGFADALPGDGDAALPGRQLRPHPARRRHHGPVRAPAARWGAGGTGPARAPRRTDRPVRQLRAQHRAAPALRGPGQPRHALAVAAVPHVWPAGDPALHRHAGGPGTCRPLGAARPRPARLPPPRPRSPRAPGASPYNPRPPHTFPAPPRRDRPCPTFPPKPRAAAPSP